MKKIIKFSFLVFSLISITANAQFIENKGQVFDRNINSVRSDVKYKFELENLNAYFKSDGIIYHPYRIEKKDVQTLNAEERKLYEKGDINAVGEKVYFSRIDFELIGANKSAESFHKYREEVVRNYYLGHIQEGIVGVNSYKQITFKNIYPNIDIKYEVIEGKLKYEFIVYPGGNVNDIKFTYNGAKKLKLNNGNLIVENDFSDLIEEKPFSFYQDSNKEIQSEFILNDKTVSFKLLNYDKTKTIVIDPAITWSTFFNSPSTDFHSNSAFDSNGNIYSAFSTYSNTWPVINAGGGQYFDNIKDGITDLIILRLNANYSQQWITYYGGLDGEYLCGTGGDYGKTLGVDASNNVYVGGYTTNSTDFPTLASGAPGAFYQSNARVFGGDTPFLLKFNSNGVRIWATIFNHENPNTNGAGNRINGIAVRGTKIYFTGEAYRFNNNDVPLRTLAGAYNNSTWVGSQDIFVGRFNEDCVLEWCTYLNGGNPANTAFKQGCDLDIDNSGNLLLVSQVSGSNNNSAYLLNPGGGAYFQNTIGGSIDHLITKFNASMIPVWSTYYGGNDLDRASQISYDPSGNILVACRTIGSTNYPVFNPGGGAFFQGTKQSPGNWTSNFSHDGGLMKFSPSGVRLWATYVGGSTTTTNSTTGIGADNNGNLYVIGYTGATNFPVVSQSGSYNQASTGGNNDLFFMQFSPTSVCSWSSYYGGSGSESCYGVKLATQLSPCGHKQFNFFSSNGTSMPTVNPGGGAFFLASPPGSNSNACILLELPGGSGLSTPPSSINASVNPTCGGSTTLSVVGGSLGTGAQWTWYSGSCGGTLVGTGANISVSPSSTTTYFVRAEGPCGNTTCVSVTITVNTNSTAPTSISASTNPTCGGATTLTVVGGSLGTGASWNWFSGSCGGTLVGTGTSITVTPSTTTTYFVRAQGTCGNTACASITITVNTNSTAPTSISASTNPTCGGATTLTVVGGSLGTGASWNWFSGSCGGTFVGTGTSVTVTPSTTTTYFVRAQGTCGNTTCASITITVNTNSTAPTSINASVNPTCGGATNLSVVGGSLGTGAQWTWYSGSCGGTLVGTGNNITVSPGVTTTYFVRAEGPCGNTTCASVTINVHTSSTAPTSILASTNPTCGGATTLTVFGGSLGVGAQWTWYSGSCGGTLVGTGNSITVSPSSTTTYFVRAQNACGNTTCASITINVHTNSTAPASINATANPICGGSTTLSVVGGSLGIGAQWTWYSGSCGGTFVGTGNTITVSPSSTTTYFVRAQNACGNTTCASITINVTVNSTAPTSINATTNPTCGGATTLSVVGGSLGVGDTWTWYSGSCGGTLVGTGNSITVSPSSTTTYFVRAEGTCGNTTCASVTINVHTTSTAPTSISATTNPTCGGSTTLSVVGGTLGAGAQWNWYSGSCGGTLVGTGNSITVSPSSTTTYFVRAENACGNTTCASLTINVHTSSTAPTSISATTNPTCGGSTTLSVVGGTLGGGAQWNWYSGSCGGTLVGTGNSITVSPSSTTTYFVRAENACGNTTCASLTINVHTSSTAPTSISATTNPTCGGSTTLSVVGGTLGAGAQWNWYSGSCGGTLVGTGNSITVSPTSTTTYFVRAENACGNTICDSVTINVHTTSTAPISINATDNPTCGGPTTLSVVGGTLGTGAQWIWYSGSCGGTLVGTGNSITVSPSSTTSYFVRAENACGNTSCASITITVNSSSIAPTSLNATNNPTCGGPTTLSIVGGTLGSGDTWTWYSGSCGGTLEGTGSSIIVNPSTTTTYFLRAEGACVSTSCISITINVDTLSTAPTQIIASATSLCEGNSVVLTVSGGSLGTGAQWEWFDDTCGGNLIGTGNSINVSPLSSTTYFVRASGNCNTTSCVSVTINVDQQTTIADAGLDEVVCGSSLVLNANIPIIGNGVWSQLSGPGILNFNSINQHNSSVNASSFGVYEAIWTITNGVCISSDTITIQFDEIPTIVSLISPQEFCGLTGALTGTNPNVGIGTWNQISGPGTLNFGNINSANSNVSSTVSGLYTIEWNVINGSCSVSDTIDIEFYNIPTPVNAGSDSSICGLSTNLNALVPNIGNGVWSQISGSSNSVFGSLNSPNTSFSSIDYGTYTLVWTVTNGACILSDTISVSFVENPAQATIITNDTTICTRNIQISALAPSAGIGYWSIISGNATISDSLSNTTIISNLSVGNNTFIWTISNGSCPPSFDTLTINVNTSSIIADFSSDSIIYAFQVISFNDLSIGNPFTWHWNFGDGDSSLVQNPGHIYTNIGTYPVTLTITNSEGCVDTITKYIDVIEKLIIPNVFTPNNDGINDVYKIIASGYSNFNMKILNRWGEILFESEDINYGWDGRSVSGSLISEGTYFYIIKLTTPRGDNIIETGPLQLLR